MLIKRTSDIAASEITPRHLWQSRREFLQQAAAAGAAMALPGLSGAAEATQKLAASKSAFVVMDKITPLDQVTSYNNFYEFGTDKADPGKTAHTLKPRPWSVTIEGAVKKPMTLDIDALLKLAPLEERVYRLRCVEGWSMVIPWIGYSLSALIKQVEPLGNAKFVEFVSLADKAQMPGVSGGALDWPYREGLRMDEAMHPLALLTLGLYGEVLPNQNGAPVRIVLPWKYGFKSAKSIVKIRFVEKQPVSSWTKAAPDEYGFYSNVNPQVDHPRWSQAGERRIDGSATGFAAFLAPKRPTLMFNGYPEVASLYAGMDLRKNF